MVSLEPGLVVLVKFPFSDLSSSKVRPAVVPAHAGEVDCVLCQVTSNPYGDHAAVPLRARDFTSGGLRRQSFARPGKLFTASSLIVNRGAGWLTTERHAAVVRAVVRILRSGVR